MKMNKRRLLKLARFLQNLPRRKFHIAAWVTKFSDRGGAKCGTVCCAWGWGPAVFPRLVKWVSRSTWGENDLVPCVVGRDAPEGYSETLTQLADFFSIPEHDADRLFYADAYQPLDEDEVTPKMVARRIRELVARGDEAAE